MITLGHLIVAIPVSIIYFFWIKEYIKDIKYNLNNGYKWYDLDEYETPGIFFFIFHILAIATILIHLAVNFWETPLL